MILKPAPAIDPLIEQIEAHLADIVRPGGCGILLHGVPAAVIAHGAFEFKEAFLDQVREEKRLLVGMLRWHIRKGGEQVMGRWRGFPPQVIGKQLVDDLLTQKLRKRVAVTLRNDALLWPDAQAHLNGIRVISAPTPAQMHGFQSVGTERVRVLVRS